MRKIQFIPANIETECATNENVFKAAERVGINIDTSCGGVGSCGLCRVKVISGDECLNAPTKADVLHLGNVYFITRERLACCMKFVEDGEVVVETGYKKV